MQINVVIKVWYCCYKVGTVKATLYEEKVSQMCLCKQPFIIILYLFIFLD